MPAIPAIIGAVGAIGGAALSNKGSKDAAKTQTSQNASDRQFTLDMANQARTDIGNIYPQMQQNTMLGGQAALTTMRNALPQQAAIRQQGTQNAIAAILGGQGTQINPNFNYIPAEIPNYQTFQQQMGPMQMLSGQPTAGNSGGSQSGFTLGNILTSPLAAVGINNSTAKKLESLSLGKKIFGGLF